MAAPGAIHSEVVEAVRSAVAEPVRSVVVEPVRSVAEDAALLVAAVLVAAVRLAAVEVAARSPSEYGCSCERQGAGSRFLQANYPRLAPCGSRFWSIRADSETPRGHD